MPTSTPEMRANRSADRRLDEWAKKLAKAKLADAQTRRSDDKFQWGALMGWLLSESKNLSAEDRAEMFAHLLDCARRMNQATRVVSQYTTGAVR
jgi:hypothetical protein